MLLPVLLLSTAFLAGVNTHSIRPDDDLVTSHSCHGRCDAGLATWASGCQCNKSCVDAVNCCSDYALWCRSDSSDSCEGRCGDVEDPNKQCQCNEHCERFDDCCHDYAELCEPKDSCEGRCGDVDDPTKQCQCNEHCERFDDCCHDYAELCEPKDSPSDEDIKEVMEELWEMDDNRVPESDIQLDTDGNRFFTYVDEGHFSKPTYAAFIKLMDNYVAEIGSPDPNPCSVCTEEQEDFLSAIMDTRLMKRAWYFLRDRGYASSSETEFKVQLSQYWFQKYTRSNGVLDSSGFEHVFIGELKSTTVGGFHNWIQFYEQEEENDLSYERYIEGCEPSTHVTVFDWEGRYKEIGSLFVGTSPEFEMAVYTVCFLTRVNGRCRISLDGTEQNIVTYTMSGVSPVTVGTSYPGCL